jgi:hypothetical protein
MNSISVSALATARASSRRSPLRVRLAAVMKANVRASGVRDIGAEYLVRSRSSESASLPIT